MNRFTVYIDTELKPIVFEGEHSTDCDDENLVIFRGETNEPDYAFNLAHLIRYTVEPLPE